MKSIKKIFLPLILLTIFGLSSCLDNKFEDIVTNTGFDYKTTKEYSVKVTTLNASNSALKGVKIELYSANPLTELGTLSENSSSNLIFKGITNSSGIMESQISVATTADSLYLLVDYIGLPQSKVVALSATDINVVIGGSVAQQVNSNGMKKVASATIPNVAKTSDGKYYLLGNWNNMGVPNYLWTPNDNVAGDLLDDINASLPERIALPVSHPEYLENADDGSLVLIEDAEVWVTFVHEGAGYTNSLLYYTYPTGNAPATASAITDPTIVYPNVSYPGSGGGLNSGNKVQLFYLNPVTKQYTNVFPAGTTVSWIFKANSWNGSGVGAGAATYYSDLRFNPETNTVNKKHNVLLKDNTRKLMIMGFEDLNRENGSDNDFNDGVFYATVTPFTAVKSDFYKPIDSPKDADNDGVGDTNDEYPNDPTKAFNNYYPSKNGTATLAFEDLWPYKGDYDFNDMVVDYNLNQITNASNQVVEIKANLTVRALGASYTNGFGFQFNTTADNIKSVSGQLLTEGIIQNLSTGAEAKQSKAVVIAFDNAFRLLEHTGSTSGVNTVIGASYVTPKTLNLDIVFNRPVNTSTMGTPPYNPFIFVNKVRSKEIHLPANVPTDLADQALLGTGDDNSNPVKGKYYMSDKYLPWAINIPVKFDYPAEKQDITKTYLLFNSWANSNGTKNTDWYLDKSGYRDNSKIYVVK